MKRSRLLATLPLVAGSLLGLAACGGSSAPATTVSIPAGAVRVTAVPTLRLDQADYGTVKAGPVTIAYSNEDSVRHTLVLGKDGNKVPNFKLVVPGKGTHDIGTVDLTPGTYVLVCDVPGHTNMKATLTVTP